MIFRGAGCLSFCKTSYTILQFYHLRMQIKICFFNPPESVNAEDRRASGTGTPPLDELTRASLSTGRFLRARPLTGAEPKHSTQCRGMLRFQRRGRIYVAARQPAAPPLKDVC